MENEKRIKKWRPNFFDIMIVAVVIAAVAGALLILRGTGDRGGGLLFAGQQEIVYYTIELQQMRGDAGERISPGDALIDRVENRPLGTVVSVELRPSQRLSKNLVTGDLIVAVIPDRIDAIIVVRANATVTDHQISIGRFILRVGGRVSVLGPLYSGGGFVIDIDRERLDR